MYFFSSQHLIRVFVTAVTLSQFSACGRGAADPTGGTTGVKVIDMNESKLVTQYDSLDVLAMPSVVPATAEQNLYVALLVSSVVEVLLEKTSMEDAELRLFGKGEFFWPKDPKKPLLTSKSYSTNNFRINFVSLSFARLSENAPWSGASLSVTPKAFPKSAFRFDLSEKVFASMKFERASTEDREANGSTPARRVHIFEYSMNERGIKLNLHFETRDDLASLDAPYLTTFDVVKIKRAAS